MDLSETALQWVKDNKNFILKRFADTDVYLPEETPVTLFMAGSPGAGKTEVSTRLIEQFKMKPVRIDADEIRKICPGYNGTNSSVFQKAADKGVNFLYDHCLHKGISVVLDGTFAYGGAMDNVGRSLDRSRRVEIYFVYQNPIQAWNITKVRELAEGRNVPKDVFIRAYLTSRINVQNIKDTYKESVILNVVFNDANKETFNLELNIARLDLSLPNEYSEDDLERSLA